MVLKTNTKEMTQIAAALLWDMIKVRSEGNIAILC